MGQVGIDVHKVASQICGAPRCPSRFAISSSLTPVKSSASRSRGRRCARPRGALPTGNDGASPRPCAGPRLGAAPLAAHANPSLCSTTSNALPLSRDGVTSPV